MASTDAMPIPRKNVAYRVTFPILDADGDLVTGASALDSEVSKDAGTFADCTNEATEIATNSGMYYLELTATEMNCDCVAIIVKTSTSGAKTVPIVLYPQETGDIKVDVQSLLGTAWLTPGTAGTPDVNVKLWNALSTVALPLVPTTAGRTLDVSTTGEAGVDWANVGSPTTSLALTGTTIAVTQKVDVDTIKTNPVVNAGTITFPTTATLASTTNITAGTIATVTTVTNQLTAAAIATGVWQDATAGDFTTSSSIGKSLYTSGNAPGAASGIALVGSNMGTITGALTAAQIATGVWQDTTAGDFTTALSVGKSVMNGVSLGTGLTVAAVSGAVGSVTGAVGSVTGNVGGNVTGSVGSVASGGITAASIAADAITAAKVADGTIDAATFAAGAINAAAIASDAITDAKVASDVTIASVTGAVGSVTGAVGSVTGAVGSVTGNVDGNVTGTVGSVVGAVGSVTGNVGGNVVGSVASVTARVTANVDQLNADATSAANIAKTTRAIGRGTASGVPTTTSIPTSAFAPATSVADQLKGRIVTFDADTTTAALRGQATDITASTSSATPTLTVTALTTAAVSGDTFSVT